MTHTWTEHDVRLDEETGASDVRGQRTGFLFLRIYNWKIAAPRNLEKTMKQYNSSPGLEI